MSDLRMSQPGDGISLLVPYRSDGGQRERNWNWLAAYWEREVPGMQVCLGDDGGTPFSRSASINAAAKQATGDVLINMDADQLVPASAIVLAATEIRRARQSGFQNWVIIAPEVNKLRRRATWRLRKSGKLPELTKRTVQRRHEQHTLCAYPREAFDLLDGMDEAFRGWGGEDTGWNCALRLLWSQPTVLGSSDSLHLFHRQEHPWRWPSATYRARWAHAWAQARGRADDYDWEAAFLTWGDESPGKVREDAYYAAMADQDMTVMRALASGKPLAAPDFGTDLRLRLGLKPINQSYSVGRVRMRQERFYGFSRPSSILHCPGMMRAPLVTTGAWETTVSQFMADEKLRGSCTDSDLTFITYNTRGKPGVLEQCLTHLGIGNVAVLGTHLNDKQWSWAQKVWLVNEYLQSGACTTEYVACLDDDDVLVFDAPGLLLDKFHAADTQMLFCRGGDSPKDRQSREFEQRTYAGYPSQTLRHLNANYLGRREYVSNRIAELASGIINPVGFDDQLAWRRIHAREYPLIKIDVATSVFTEFSSR